MDGGDTWVDIADGHLANLDHLRQPGALVRCYLTYTQGTKRFSFPSLKESRISLQACVQLSAESAGGSGRKAKKGIAGKVQAKSVPPPPPLKQAAAPVGFIQTIITSPETLTQTT